MPLHLSGLRGAPPGPHLAADYVGTEGTRPQSAISMLRSAADNVRCAPGAEISVHPPHRSTAASTDDASPPLAEPFHPDLTQVPSSFASKRQAPRAERPIPERSSFKKNIYTMSWEKASTREQWVSMPIR